MINNAMKYKGISAQIIRKIGSVSVVKIFHTNLIIFCFEYRGIIKVGDTLI